MCSKFIVALVLYCCVAFKFMVHGYDIHHLQCDCGRANEMASKIVGGSVVPANKYPWMVTVHTTNFNYEVFCGGALITRQYVLTAAHCVEKMGNRKVGIAVHDKDRLGLTIPALLVKIHPQYRYGEIRYDIALIKLQKAVTISEKVRTLCLPHNLYLEQAGQHAIAAGWGMTQPKGSQSRFLKETSLKILNSDWIITAQGVNRTGVCQGDSGSPLFTRYKDGKYHVIGVSSQSEMGLVPCLGKSFFPRVSIHNQWIRQNIKDSVPCEKANDQMPPVETNYL